MSRSTKKGLFVEPAPYGGGTEATNMGETKKMIKTWSGPSSTIFPVDGRAHDRLSTMPASTCLCS